jgi:hypothetical protein
VQARKEQLTQNAETAELSPPIPRALSVQSTSDYQERDMARYSNDRGRVERGRFMSVAVGSVIRKGTQRLRVNAGGG